MTSPHLAKLAAKLLSTDSTSPPPGVGRADREHLIASIEAALRTKARRKRARRWAIGLSAAAAVVVCASAGPLAIGRARDPVSVAPFAATATTSTTTTTTEAPTPSPTVVGQAIGGDVTVTSPGATTPLGQERSLVVGSRVVARAGGRALLAFSTGSHLTLEDEGDMTIVSQGTAQVFALDAGALRADVAKLSKGQRFVVQTADAEVEARGTSFRVAVVPADPSCNRGTTTRVAVYEGTVVVRRDGAETRVSAGEVWPARCGVASPPARATAASRAVVDTGRRAVPAARAEKAPVETSVSSLAEQNDRFAEAIVAKRLGRSAVAIASFERFLAAYPASPLTENATVERMKLLAATDPARGAAAARAYLSRYPDGFARATAEALATDKP